MAYRITLEAEELHWLEGLAQWEVDSTVDLLKHSPDMEPNERWDHEDAIMYAQSLLRQIKSKGVVA